MESIASLSIIIKIASICLQNCTFIRITMLLITTCCKKLSTEKSDTVQELKPKVSKETIKSPAQRRAIAKIREGEMIPANQSETIDDAMSKWEAVQKVERKVPLKKVCNLSICY
ncbi:unnamed protein product [Brugia pahangi]|uniref:Band_7_C domain-containing protein n=1 Tax=Brugia pahangi TaxID=6280 RepID=A0A0N4T1C4_BRUPA|nr:unnamed protein product [Brugia pahangi]